MTTAPFDVDAARMLAIEAMRVPTAGHSTDRGALITTILAACDTLDAWRFVTGADTPEALAAELDAYRAIARQARATPDDPAPPHGANT